MICDRSQVFSETVTYCEEKYMFTKRFNILKKSACTEKASMNGIDVHILKKLK